VGWCVCPILLPYTTLAFQVGNPVGRKWRHAAANLTSLPEPAHHLTSTILLVSGEGVAGFAVSGDFSLLNDSCASREESSNGRNWRHAVANITLLPGHSGSHLNSALMLPQLAASTGVGWCVIEISQLSKPLFVVRQLLPLVALAVKKPNCNGAPVPEKSGFALGPPSRFSKSVSVRPLNVSVVHESSVIVPWTLKKCSSCNTKGPQATAFGFTIGVKIPSILTSISSIGPDCPGSYHAPFRRCPT